MDKERAGKPPEIHAKLPELRQLHKRLKKALQQLKNGEISPKERQIVLQVIAEEQLGLAAELNRIEKSLEEKGSTKQLLIEYKVELIEKLLNDIKDVLGRPRPKKEELFVV